MTIKLLSGLISHDSGLRFEQSKCFLGLQEAFLSFEEALCNIRGEMVSLLRTGANVQARDVNVSPYSVNAANTMQLQKTAA